MLLRTLTSLSSAGALLLLTSLSQLNEPTASASAFQGLIQSIDSALVEQDRSVRTDEDVLPAFSSIDALRFYGVNALRQSSRASLSIEEQFCAEPWLAKFQGDLQVIGEYFSVSNDGAQKMMVGDAFRGQKLNFVKQGIAASREDLRQLRKCIR